MRIAQPFRDRQGTGIIVAGETFRAPDGDLRWRAHVSGWHIGADGKALVRGTVTWSLAAAGGAA